jgi:hypothetical protein
MSGSVIFGEQFRSDQQEFVCVHREHLNCRSANGRLARQSRAVGLKMVCPRVDPRIKEPGKCPCVRVEPCNIRALKPVAVRASKRKIVLAGRSVMFFSEDMVDLKWQREGELGNQTVLATFSSASPDPPDEFPIH